MAIPTIDQLKDSPELASLALLDVALQTASAALVTVHDLHLVSQQLPCVRRHVTPTTQLAKCVVGLCAGLRDALTAYKEVTLDYMG